MFYFEGVLGVYECFYSSILRNAKWIKDRFENLCDSIC